MVYRILASLFDRHRFLAGFLTLSGAMNVPSGTFFRPFVTTCLNFRPSQRPNSRNFFHNSTKLLVGRANYLVRAYIRARDHSPYNPGHRILTHSAAMPTTPTAQKGIVPKESVYVRFVDWGCGPCTKYVVFYTYRDETNTHGVGLQIHIVFIWLSCIRHSV